MAYLYHSINPSDYLLYLCDILVSYDYDAIAMSYHVIIYQSTFGNLVLKTVGL